MKRTIIFFLAVLLLPLLFATLLLFDQAQAEQSLDLKSRLKATPGTLYIINGIVNMEPIEDAPFVLSIENQELSKFRFLSFTDVQGGDLYQVKLQWRQQNQLLFEQPAIRGIGNLSVVLPKPFPQATDLKLLILLNRIEQPGIVGQVVEPFSFSQIQLQTDSAQARLQQALNTWFEFVPISFHSMNYWHKADSWFSIWLLLTIFAYICLVVLTWRLLKLSSNHLIGFCLLFFVVISSSYWFNQWRLFNLRQNSHSFEQNSLAVNRSDKRLIAIAQKVLHNYAQRQSNKPLLIIKEDDFERTRLAYHLSSLNVYHMPFVDDLLAFIGKYGGDYLLLIETRAKNCQFDLLNKLSHHYELLWQQQDYCLLSL